MRRSSGGAHGHPLPGSRTRCHGHRPSEGTGQAQKPPATQPAQSPCPITNPKRIEHPLATTTASWTCRCRTYCWSTRPKFRLWRRAGLHDERHHCWIPPADVRGPSAAHSPVLPSAADHLSQVRSEHVLVNSSLLCLESIRCPAIRVANRFTGLQAEEGTARSVLLSTGRAVLPPGDDKITSPCIHPASPTVRLRRDRCAEHARVAATRVAIRCDRIGLHACRAALLIPRTAAGTAGVTEAT